MILTSHTIKRTALATAITATLGAAAIPEQASAANLTFSISGWFTLLDPSGTGALNNGDASGPPMYGNRTPVSGTMSFDTATNSGTLSLQPFSFFAGGPAAATNITFQDNDGPGGAGTLILGNMGFNWSGTNGIPVSLAWDGAGLLAAINPVPPVGSTIAATGATFACDTNITCAAAATEGFLFGAKASYTLPLGPSPMVTTTFDTTTISGAGIGSNPSGTLPLIADTIGGSPMIAGPFPGFHANFDFDSMTLTSDGSGSITAPADASDTIPETPPLPATSPIDLGPATGVLPPGTAEYCTDGSVAACDAVAVNGWIADDGTNTINVPITQTVNTVNVDWRAGGGLAFDAQTATVTVDDMTAPVIDSTFTPTINTSVISTSDSVCFGAITATDNVEPSPNLTLEWSHDNFNWNAANPNTSNLTDNCSTGFGPDANTLFWRAVDVAGNTATYQQSVTLNLPTGITGKACTIDLATAGSRLLEGNFTMRDSSGAITGTVDTGVTGDIDTTVFCTDTDIANCNPNPPAAALAAGQPFFGFTWTATPVRLYSAGTWDFETCPFPRTGVDVGLPTEDWVSPDSSNKCGDEFTPNILSMTVNPGQIGAHMLFTWASNPNIDVVVVWDADCNKFELTTTDPDNDGILSTPMVDGPFKGFNAAFDVNTLAGEPPIADGGYTTTILTAQNPVAGESPPPVTPLALPAFTADPAAVRSCVGDCIKFSTTTLLNGMDAGGAYKYVQVVHPLTEATPFWSQYRKYDEATNTWGPFVIDGRNDVKTAQLDPVAMECPEPGNGGYDRPFSGALADKLRENDMCLQVTIENDGPNDFNPDPTIVDDPGGVAELPAGVLPNPDTSGGGCSLSTTPADPAKGGAWWILTGLLGWMGWRRRRT